MLTGTDSVLAGVSGGADSVSLALVLKELGYRLAIAHLNHGLRGEAADEDEYFSRNLAGLLGVPFFTRKVLTLAEARNVEAAGRAARKAFFRETADAHGYTRIALAHTRDDRVETFLMNLLRGSGLEGLVSMSAVSGTTIRPLIDTSRTEVESYLEERGQSWRTDLTNLDLAFTRNRLRHKVIPMLSAEFNQRLPETLARTLEILESEDAWMRAFVEECLEEHGSTQQDAFVLDLPALGNVHTAIFRRIIRMALRRGGSTLQEVSFDHIESIFSLLQEGKSGKVIGLPDGMTVERSFDQLLFRKRLVVPRDYSYDLHIPGLIHVPELGKTFRAEIVDGKVESTPDKVFVDGGSLGPYVKIRNWKPGDYYRPVGLPSGKLKRLFQRARIPRNQRSSWPVFVTNSTIVWVASFPVSREFAPGENSQKIVVFEASTS
jgi:tRNA(Ile)-lysidine synthase